MAAIIPSTMKAVIAQEGKCVVRSEYPVPQFGDGEVLVRVHACGVNRLDIMQRSGKVKPPPGCSSTAAEVLGMEVAGDVVAVSSLPPPPHASPLLPENLSLLLLGGYFWAQVGAGAEGFAVGDRVMALVSGGGYAEYCACPASTTLQIPPSLSYQTAAGIPEV